jgi:hypothetical protein
LLYVYINGDVIREGNKVGCCKIFDTWDTYCTTAQENRGRGRRLYFALGATGHLVLLRLLKRDTRLFSKA